MCSMIPSPKQRPVESAMPGEQIAFEARGQTLAVRRRRDLVRRRSGYLRASLGVNCSFELDRLPVTEGALENQRFE